MKNNMLDTTSINNESISKLETDKSFAEKVKYINKANKKHEGIKSVPNSKNYIIELNGVEKYFTNGSVITYILKGISFRIKKGDFVVILGKSGSGKTTLMNIMSGLIRATEGEVIVNNNNLINLKDSELVEFRKNNISYIFQDYGLLSTLNVYENVKLGYLLNKKNQGKQKNEIAKKKIILQKKTKKFINDILKTTNLLDHRKKFPYELSGGQQQRVAICRALAKAPDIIFGDEPTGALDSKMSSMVLSLLQKVNKEKGTTIVLITHDSEIAKIANYVIHIKEGIIQETTRNDRPLEASLLYEDK